MENKYVELEKLLKLKEQGAITVSEYEEEKKKILEKSNKQVNQNNNEFRFDIIGLTLSVYCAIFLIMDYCMLGIVSFDIIINLILCVMSFFAIRKCKEGNKKIVKATNIINCISVITLVPLALKVIKHISFYKFRNNNLDKEKIKWRIKKYLRRQILL